MGLDSFLRGAANFIADVSEKTERRIERESRENLIKARANYNRNDEESRQKYAEAQEQYIKATDTICASASNRANYNLEKNYRDAATAKDCDYAYRDYKQEQDDIDLKYKIRNDELERISNS